MEPSRTFSYPRSCITVPVSFYLYVPPFFPKPWESKQQMRRSFTCKYFSVRFLKTWPFSRTTVQTWNSGSEHCNSAGLVCGPSADFGVCLGGALYFREDLHSRGACCCPVSFHLDQCFSPCLSWPWHSQSIQICNSTLHTLSSLTDSACALCQCVLTLVPSGALWGLSVPSLVVGTLTIWLGWCLPTCSAVKLLSFSVERSIL